MQHHWNAFLPFSSMNYNILPLNPSRFYSVHNFCVDCWCQATEPFFVNCFCYLALSFLTLWSPYIVYPHFVFFSSLVPEGGLFLASFSSVSLEIFHQFLLIKIICQQRPFLCPSKELNNLSVYSDVPSDGLPVQTCLITVTGDNGSWNEPFY